MSELLRRVFSVIVALAVAWGIIAIVDVFAAQIHPLPAGVDPTDLQSLKGALEAGSIPMAALILIASGWLLAAYVGGRISIGMARDDGAVWVFAVIFTIGVYSNLAALPHPEWMWITGLAGCPLFALAAGRQSVQVPRPPVR
jgi:hypothetical protein